MTFQCPWIYEACGREDNDMVGKKSANLGELKKAGVRVPPMFAFSVSAYEKFLTETGALEEIRKYLSGFKADPGDARGLEKYERAGCEIRSIVESKAMPADLEVQLAKHYEHMCTQAGIVDVPVATRSAGPASHPGQYETYLHISGLQEVAAHVIKVWSSTFNARSLIARARHGLPLDFDPIGVCVLKMVNARAAGVMFTLNPVNGDRSKISVGASWGLGEAVVSGEVTNDEFIIDKVTFEIIERIVSDKTFEYQRDKATGRLTRRDVPDEKRMEPCLSDQELLELAREAKRIEKYFGVPQDIEWAVDEDSPFPQNIYFVQARPETIWSKAKAKESVDTKSIFGDLDLARIVKVY
ncbi:MAG: Phosphoenolpyruvate synthase [Syntrophorhabdus sp. PtaU1.Bin153]|nr:MAG: Phosphoenolpyruvate synthase [Syntrophorhabdus sp. PtaU1.Bin153]